MHPVLALRHVPHEELGTLAGALAEAGVPLTIVDLFESVPDELPLTEAAGLIVMGGPMNVDDTNEFPYLAAEVRWIQAAVAAELPFLGVCLGSQLLAKSLGGRVYPNRVKEIGWYPIEFLPAARIDRLFRAAGTEETLFQWHGDTFQLPAGAVQLARSENCEQQAFRYGPSAYGLQFHLEMTAGMIADWLAEPCMCAEVGRLPYIDAQVTRDQTPGNLPRLNALAGQVFGEFARLCRERR